ncbi:MAG TPA: hypothetical protein PLD47_14265 [Aggregatilineales bacterium]|nr:hypothetical protein [Anaerolineales bacterium]HRE48887.1 hypothetical protein [Aggregatilineales bacterium]
MREALKGYLAIGVLVGGGGIVLMFMNRPGTAPFIVSLCSAIIGGVLIITVILVARWMKESS